jgi:hypothetical protein
MALAIDIAYVEAVLLSDGWHHVMPRTFVLDRYEFVTATDAQAEDGLFDVVYPGPAEPVLVGFAFLEQDSLTSELRSVAGPMASIQAFRYAERPGDPDDRADEPGMTTY